MKISIITPFLKGKQYLTDYFESLCSQQYTDFEVVFVLAPEAEDVSEILSKYQEKLQIRVVSLEQGGVATARNIGIKEAQGEFVYFMDADDFLIPDTLARLMRMLSLYPDTELLYGNKKRTWYKRSITLETRRQNIMKRWQRILVRNGVEVPEEADEEQLLSLLASIGKTPESIRDEDDERRDAVEIDESEADLSKETASSDEDEGYDDDEELTDEEETGSATAQELERLKRKGRAGRLLITKRKGLKNISALHILIKRAFLLENNITFDENAVYYADLRFTAVLLENIGECRRVISSVYYQRRHNDPINLPSIAQQKSPERFEELLSAYETAIAALPQDSRTARRLDRKIINYYCNFFAVKMHRSPLKKWKEERFEQMRRIVSQIDPEYIKNFKSWKRRLIKALVAGKQKKSERMITARLARKKLIRLIKSPKKIKREVYNHIYKKMPLKENMVLFECFFGGFYSDSPKYIYEQLIKAYPGEYNCVWVYKTKKMDIPFPCKQVKRFSLAYYKCLATSKYFVFNNRQPAWMKKRNGMVFLETWHGTPLKRLTFDQEEVLSASPKHKELMYKSSRRWNYLVSPNEFSTHTFRSCFMFNNEMLNTGYPRNDILHKEGKEEFAKQIRNKLGIPLDKKTILYAPTWRDDEFYGSGQYKFTLKLDLQQMKEQLPDDYVVLLRTHYYIADAIDTTGLEGFVYNVCRYNDIAELYLISDILITDYSSVFFDYAGLRRPMLFYTYDLEKYRDDLRGFYISIENEVPGPLLFTTDEVIDAIKNIDQVNEKYAALYDEFYQRFCAWEDGRAAEKIVDYVFKGKEFDNHAECEPDRLLSSLAETDDGEEASDQEEADE